MIYVGYVIRRITLWDDTTIEKQEYFNEHHKLWMLHIFNATIYLDSNNLDLPSGAELVKINLIEDPQNETIRTPS